MPSNDEEKVEGPMNEEAGDEEETESEDAARKKKMKVRHSRAPKESTDDWANRSTSTAASVASIWKAVSRCWVCSADWPAM